MNCEQITKRIDTVSALPLSDAERRSWSEHLANCDECQWVLQGAEALQVVRNQPDVDPPEDLFENILNRTAQTQQQPKQRKQFWLGAGFGGAVAAAIVVAVMTLGVFSEPAQDLPTPVEFMVSMHETRNLYIAIDAEYSMDGAKLSVVLPVGVALSGFNGQRELVWTDDLVAGVNKLTLPLIALGQGGGQMVVTLDHENNHQVFIINLKLDG